MKDGMKQYAFKSGKVKESYLRKHQDGSSSRKAYEASRRHRLQQSRQVQEEEVTQVPGISGQLEEENTTTNNEEIITVEPRTDEEMVASQPKISKARKKRVKK